MENELIINGIKYVRVKTEVEKDGLSLDFTPETKTLDFVEKIGDEFRVYFGECDFFYCYPNNLNYGVHHPSSNQIEKNNFAVFEKKQYKDLKEGDVWFEDKEKIKIYDVNFMINKNKHSSLYYSTIDKYLTGINFYTKKDDYVWVARRE